MGLLNKARQKEELEEYVTLNQPHLYVYEAPKPHQNHLTQVPDGSHDTTPIVMLC
jgi:hypothetical protein